MSISNVSLRPMRLKVLYTFDPQSRINCLARWPHVVNIQTVELDEATRVGVIELKTCIHAVVSASPELVANLGQDYTVYANDYSEQDTPLVGQGMLSWILASPSSTTGTSTPSSRALVTGRVCQNVLGLFTNGAETLEVRLRLLPVANSLQSESIRNMERYRDLSRTMPTGSDMSAMPSFVQGNSSLGQTRDNSTGPSYVGAKNRSDVGMETLNQIMNQGLSPASIIQSLEESVNQTFRDTHSIPPSVYGDISRTASPITGFIPPGDPYSMSHEVPQRPSSQTSTRALTNTLQNEASFTQQVEGGIEDIRSEDGPVKKRVRTIQTGWNGKASIGTNSEPLRVTASASASMRGLRPVAPYPSDSVSNHLQEPPRPPTPRPEEAKKGRPRGRPPNRSKLSNAKTQTQQAAPRADTQTQSSGTRSVSSTSYPGGTSYGIQAHSPLDMASSPPTFERGMTVPSSPVLPALPHQVDSGFMSGPVEGCPADDDEMRPIDKEDLEVAAQYSKRSSLPTTAPLMIQEVTPGPPELLPTRILPRPVNVRRKDTSRAPSAAASEPNRLPEGSPSPPVFASQNPINSDIPQRPQSSGTDGVVSTTDVVTKPPPPSWGLTRTPSIGGLTLPTHTASDPVVSISTGRHQSPPNNIPSNQSQNTGADVAQAGDDRGNQLRSGSGAKRKKAIQKKLVTAIETGTMPPFCENCGAIETPTWRKVWSKRLEGSPEDIKISDEEGGVVAIHDLLKDDAGNVTSFCILKKALLVTDENFRGIQLCNPCGLWFQKTKSMRPEHKWNKDAKNAEKKKRAPRKRKQSAVTGGDAAVSTPSEGPNPQMDNATVPHGHENDTTHDVEASTIDGPPSKRTRAASAQLRNSPKSGDSSMSTADVLKRYVQSSPARLLGTQVSPIDVDDWGSTRRILFPSPKKTEGSKPLQDITANPHQRPAKPISNDKALAELSPTSSDKENRAPPPGQDDDLSELFEDGDENSPSTPKKTPSTPPKKTPKGPLSPGRKTNKPESSPWKFDLSSNHGLLPRTPSSRNKSPRSNNGAAQYSPFTAQMYQLLSEANNGSPTGNQLDFPSLPGLGDLLPMTGTGTTPSRTYQFTQLCGEDMFSTDVPMPSSPPGMFSLYKDPVEDTADFWTDFDMAGNPQQMVVGSKEVEMEGVSGGSGKGGGM
ncbi:MAG: hypothetical protein M1816_004864 [Peltula sp. TS41687]|nr:MAG: hypothetical protein M1816_004864 [Peltula sp. TS41687]